MSSARAAKIVVWTGCRHEYDLSCTAHDSDIHIHEVSKLRCSASVPIIEITFELQLHVAIVARCTLCRTCRLWCKAIAATATVGSAIIHSADCAARNHILEAPASIAQAA